MRATRIFSASDRRVRRVLRHLSWPVIVGLIALSGAGAARLGTWYFDGLASKAAAAANATRSSSSAKSVLDATPTAKLTALPPPAQYMADVASAVRLAKAGNLHVDNVEYGTEVRNAVPLRTIRIHSSGEYSDLKRVIADLSNSAPHAALLGLNIERSDPKIPQVSATIKIGLLYAVNSDRIGDAP